MDKLQWGNRKFLRRVKMKDSSLNAKSNGGDVSTCAAAGIGIGIVDKKISSRVIDANKHSITSKDPPPLSTPLLSNSNSKNSGPILTSVKLIPMQWNARFEVNFLADQLRRCSTLKQLESWYALFLKNNTSQDCFLMNQYITACSKVGSIDSAAFAFTQMDNPNVFVYNAIIGAFLNCFRPLEGLNYFVAMLRNGVRPSSYTFPLVIKSSRVFSIAGFGESIHGQVLRNGLGSHIHVQTAIVDFYSSFGRVLESMKVFDEMSERDGFAWSTMISAHARAGELDSARKVFDEMPEKNTAAWNTMIHGFVKAGDLKGAEALFGRMHNKDVISWTTMINCYSKHKLYREALETFDEMKNAGITPDDTTLATVISACAHLGALDKGKEMHLYIMRTRSNIDVYIGSELIDMYAKCGVLEKALVVFYKLQEKNLFCWSSVIDGLAYHGYAEEALAMLDKMEKEKIKPNRVVFPSALAACTHAGFVEEGKRRFLEMTTKYSIQPEIEHYGCMVDLLSRVGLLEEALALIRSMRMEPNLVIWGALLSGCKLHKKLEIAEVAVERLMVLEPNNSGYYTLLISVYAEANRWNEVARIRGMMRACGVEKVLPGCSWIEVEKKMHQFAACDNHHPASRDIHQVLEELDSQLKLFGNAPQLDFIIKTTPVKEYAKRGFDESCNVSVKEENQKIVWPRLLISLSSKEKEEDFMLMKGCKPSQRPKKRAKLIQRAILSVSPGAWLSDVCRERYEVREKKSSKKKPGGLKAMGGMDFDSE